MPMTKRQAKKLADQTPKQDKSGSMAEYLEYKRKMVTAGQPFVGFGQWKKQRGGG